MNTRTEHQPTINLPTGYQPTGGAASSTPTTSHDSRESTLIVEDDTGDACHTFTGEDIGDCTLTGEDTTGDSTLTGEDTSGDSTLMEKILLEIAHFLEKMLLETIRILEMAHILEKILEIAL